jgi:DNA-binding CsgD family transcriptional regulator
MITQPGSVKEPVDVRDELQFLRTFRHALEPARHAFEPARHVLGPALEPARQALEPARHALVPARERVAELRGAGMSLIATAAEYVLVHTAVPAQPSGPVVADLPFAEPLVPLVPFVPLAEAFAGPFAQALAEPATAPAATLTATLTAALTAVKLSPREQELVSLVARGYTDAQIAAELYITVRTVSSHLDRIRNKTGCRRRADLTRLAHSTGLV